MSNRLSFNEQEINNNDNNNNNNHHNPDRVNEKK